MHGAGRWFPGQVRQDRIAKGRGVTEERSTGRRPPGWVGWLCVPVAVGCLLVPLAAQRPSAKGTKAIVPAAERSRRWQDHEDLEPMWCEAHARALEWLAAGQEPDGSWPVGDDPGRDLAIASLALLALQSSGATTLRGGAHRVQLQQGAQFLWLWERNAAANERDGGHGVLFGRALGILAAAEIDGLGRNTTLARSGAEAAAQLAVQADLDRACFLRGDRPDAVQTAWAAAALLAADGRGGFRVPDVMGGVPGFLVTLTGGSGRIGWQDPGGPPPPRLGTGGPSPLVETATAAGLYVQLLAGHDPADPLFRRGIELLRRAPPRWDAKAGTVDPVYWWFGARVAERAGGECRAVWRRALREQVVLAQERAGKSAGSWPPVGPWADELGRVGTTALIALALAAPCTEPPAAAEGQR